jgi:hypothetical protein
MAGSVRSSRCRWERSQRVGLKVLCAVLRGAGSARSAHLIDDADHPYSSAYAGDQRECAKSAARRRLIHNRTLPGECARSADRCGQVVVTVRFNRDDDARDGFPACRPHGEPSKPVRPCVVEDADDQVNVASSNRSDRQAPNAVPAPTFWCRRYGAPSTASLGPARDDGAMKRATAISRLSDVAEGLERDVGRRHLTETVDAFYDREWRRESLNRPRQSRSISGRIRVRLSRHRARRRAASCSPGESLGETGTSRRVHVPRSPKGRDLIADGRFALRTSSGGDRRSAQTKSRDRHQIFRSRALPGECAIVNQRAS